MSYFKSQEITSGSYFNGSLISQDDVLIIAEDEINQISIRKLLSLLSTSEIDQVLSIAKSVRIQEINIENQNNLKTAFEYPANSGNIFSITNQKGLEISALNDLKNILSYPYTYSGLGTSYVTFQSSSEIESFFQSAFLVFNQIQQIRYIQAITSVRDISITSDLMTAISDVFNIQY